MVNAIEKNKGREQIGTGRLHINQGNGIPP